MSARLVMRCAILALFLMASIIASFVSPVMAGPAPAHGEAAVAMDAAMPCCGPEQPAPGDCAEDCKALTFCLAKCIASVTFSIARPLTATASFVLSERSRDSRLLDPPAKPPRTRDIAGV